MARGSDLVDAFRGRVRSGFKRTFHSVIGWLGFRRLREHSFFANLLPRPATLVDMGAHRGEFFNALKSEHPVSRAVLVEADPSLAESLKLSFGDDANVIHGAAVAANEQGRITFNRSVEPESSSIFSEWSAAYGIADQVKVPAVNLREVFKRLGVQIDLLKMDVEGAEIGILESASASDLASCCQLTVEFHDKRPPFTRGAPKDLARAEAHAGHGGDGPDRRRDDDRAHGAPRVRRGPRHHPGPRRHERGGIARRSPTSRALARRDERGRVLEQRR